MQDRDTQIENYLLGKLTAAEKQAFESEMGRDAVLSTEVHEQRFIIGGLNDSHGAAQFRALLADISAKNAAEIPPTAHQIGGGRVVPMRRRLFSSLAIAASLALAFFGWKYFLASPTASPEQLFAANFTQPEALSLGGVRGGAASDPDSLAIALTDEANVFFQKKDFKNAHERLDRAIAAAKSPAKKSAALRAKGQAFLMEKKFEEAETAFLKITGESAEERDWFVALAVLAQPERVGEARRLFEAFAKNKDYEGPRQVKAAKILEDLK